MFTLNDILQGNAGQIQIISSLPLSPTLSFREAQYDSRHIEPHDLFLAFNGEHTDGHRFIPDAARAGARGALCSHPSADVGDDFLHIVVPDVVEALQKTARVRAQRQAETTFIGITGSNGKTSTTNAVAAVLSRQASTLKTLKSYNNEIGYPLTLLRLEAGHRYAVLEMGAQWVGELTGLCQNIATPDWSLITLVGSAHLEHFGSPENVAQAKSELVQVLQADGLAILNYDDPRVRAMSKQTIARTLFYGISPEAQIRGSEIRKEGFFERSFLLQYQGQQQRLRLRLPGEHGVMIALAGAAAGAAASVPFDAVCTALESLTPAPGRGELKEGPQGCKLIDDTYNASPQSILAITTTLAQAPLASGGKRWAVLGDMFELGEFAQAEHFRVGSTIATQVDSLLAVGDQARWYMEGALEAGMPPQNVFYFPADVSNASLLKAAKQTAADFLLQKVHSDDIVLLKGSRGMQMETILPLLQVSESKSYGD